VFFLRIEKAETMNMTPKTALKAPAERFPLMSVTAAAMSQMMPMTSLM
jgi:hypothetical protein